MISTSIFWFRRDLRFNDNAGLHAALCYEKSVLPIFIFDSEILDKLENKKDARVQFIHDTVSQLKDTLQQKGSDLRIYLGRPIEIFEQLCSEFQINSVYTNEDYEPYAIKRDERVQTFLSKKNIELNTFKDHVIFSKQEILSDSGGVYKVFTPYSRKWKAKLEQSGLEQYPSALDNDNWLKIQPQSMPSLNNIGFSNSDIEIPSSKIDESLLSHYAQLRDYPARNNTSKLGIHFRFGTLSIREAVKKALEYSEVWLNELIWREFYSQILFNFPHVVEEAFKAKYDHIPWRQDEKGFESWCKGETGYPIVDAGMRELNNTGFMHNRVRMITASFLTKHLLIDWRWGEAYFASKLLDFELASNNGGWQWAAGTGTDAQPYFRVFNPYAQQEKFDPQLEYVRKWVPEFDTMNYVPPIVEHKFARQRAIDVYKEALA